MWFKNVRVYTLDTGFKYSTEELDKLLAPQKYTPCSGQDMVRFGWVSNGKSATGLRLPKPFSVAISTYGRLLSITIMETT